MPLLSELESINTRGLEGEIALGIVERIARKIPELTDHSPTSPHVILAEGVAWGEALMMYYAQHMPELVEEWLIREVFRAQPYPAQNARASLRLTYSTPAPATGRTILAGTKFTAGGTSWTVIDPYTYPEGAYGNEVVDVDGVRGWRYLVPVACDQPGVIGNVPAGTITRAMGSMPGVLEIINPERATGGRETETYAEMRQRIFAAPLLNDTLVTPRDFERAVIKYYAGLALVHVITPPVTPGRTSLSVLTPDGTPLVSEGDLHAYLSARAPSAPIEFVPPDVTLVNVSATLTYDSSVALGETVRLDAEEKLRGMLAPLAWTGWGQEINVLYPSRIVDLLHTVPGVVSVTLTEPAAPLDLGQPHATLNLGAALIETRPQVKGGEAT